MDSIILFMPCYVVFLEEHLIAIIFVLSRDICNFYDVDVQPIVIIPRNLLNRLAKEVRLDKLIPPIENTR